MDLAQLVTDAESPVGLRIQVVAIVEVVLHCLSKRRQVAGLLQAFDGGLALEREPQMPCSEAGNDYANDARKHGEQNVVDGHEGLGVLVVAQDLSPDPCRRGGKAHPAEEGEVDQEQQEGLVVAQAHAGREPGAVVVHLQDTALACRAVVGAVRLVRLALVAEAHAAVGGLDSEGRVLQTPALLGGQIAVAIGVAEGRAGVGEDGGGVAPVEEAVEDEAEGRGEVACAGVSALHVCLRAAGVRTGPGILGGHKADADLDPAGPRGQAVDEQQREVGDGVAAVALDLAGPGAGRIAREGDDGGEGEPSVAMLDGRGSRQLSSQLTARGAGVVRDRA